MNDNANLVAVVALMARVEGGEAGMRRLRALDMISEDVFRRALRLSRSEDFGNYGGEEFSRDAYMAVTEPRRQVNSLGWDAQGNRVEA